MGAIFKKRFAFFPGIYANAVEKKISLEGVFLPSEHEIFRESNERRTNLTGFDGVNGQTSQRYSSASYEEEGGGHLSFFFFFFFTPWAAYTVIFEQDCSL